MSSVHGTPASATPLAIARRLRDVYGFSVIPVHPESKRPAVPWTAFQARLPIEAELRTGFAMHVHNIGIVTGRRSNLVVIDLDDDEAEAWAQQHLSPTPMAVRTGGGGLHLYFRHPGGHVGNRVRVQPVGCPHALRLDVRGDGGCVVGPGSVHGTTGRLYLAPKPWPLSLDAVPVYDPSWLREAPPPVVPPRIVRPTTGVPVLARARAYLATMPCPEIGCGSDQATLEAACRMVRGFALSAADAEDLLSEWCGHQAWSRDWVASKVRNALRYGTEPIGGLL